jgi:hypothetical protein
LGKDEKCVKYCKNKEKVLPLTCLEVRMWKWQLSYNLEN